jgi:SPP1 family predicted phage head-tail adaptor
MKYRLELQRPVVVPNEFGEMAPTFEVTKTIHAERVKMSGRRRIEMGELTADYSVDFNVRDVHEVSEGWRVRQLGGYLYSVTNVTPNADRGYKTLTCDRVNE